MLFLAFETWGLLMKVTLETKETKKDITAIGFRMYYKLKIHVTKFLREVWGSNDSKSNKQKKWGKKYIQVDTWLLLLHQCVSKEETNYDGCMGKR